ncbi:MAG: cell division ATP-binding protein FtsE [Sphingobacteriaceae bacterium]|jgi:cell division transport system ATP-binding protein
METNSPIIQLQDINVFQQDHLVLSGVTLTINKGEFVFLIGQTGSGKSSLLKTIYGDLKISQGNGEVVGYSLTTIKEKEVPFMRRKMGIVFQDFQLLTDRSVEENLKFVMSATGWDDPKMIAARTEEVINEVGLAGKNHKMPHQLSGGEQQRVVIARAMVNHPAVILADEPTGNLDPDSSIEIMNLLLKISKMGTAVVMATHDYRMIEKFPSRIIKCEKGKIIEDHYQTV